MSYTPTNWKSGDVVTSAKLNNIEGGIDQFFIVHATGGYDSTLEYSVFTGDCTGQELVDAFEAGKIVIVCVHEIDGPVVKDGRVLLGYTYDSNNYDYGCETYRFSPASDDVTFLQSSLLVEADLPNPIVFGYFAERPESGDEIK